MDVTAVPVRRADCRVELLDEEMLVYKPGDTKAIFFNQTASLVWHLCDGQHSVAQIVALLADAYPDAEDTIADDVQGALDRLAEQGCLDVT